MQVNGSTQTLSSPGVEKNKEIFETLSRIQDKQLIPGAGKKEAEGVADQPAKPELKKPTINLEEIQKMVLRPSEVPLEERLSQVVSLEDIQRLLLLRLPAHGDQSLRGNIVDRMA